MSSEQIPHAEEQAELPNALQDAEIARIMKLVSGSGYKKSEDAPTRKKQEFKPRSLVEIAMEAQRKSDSEDKKPAIDSTQTVDTPLGDTRVTGKNAENPTSKFDKKDSEKIEADSELSENKKNKLVENQIESEVVEPSEKSSDSPLNTKVNEEPDNAPSENKKGDVSDNFIPSSEAESESNQTTDITTKQYDKGYNDGLEAGKIEMKSELEQKFSEQESTFNTLIARLTKMDHAETEQLEKDIKNAILLLASERAGVAIREMPEHFSKKVESLITRLGNNSTKPLVKLNKDDLRHLEIVKAKSELLSHISFSEDETLNHGDITVSSGGIEIEDILEKQFSDSSPKIQKKKNYTPIPKPNSQTDIPISTDIIEPEIEKTGMLNDSEKELNQLHKSNDFINPETAEDGTKPAINREKEDETAVDSKQSADENQETSS